MMIAGRLRNGAVKHIVTNKDDPNYQLYKEKEFNGNQQRCLSGTLQLTTSVDRKHGFDKNATKKIVNTSKIGMQQTVIRTANIVDFHLLLNIGGAHFRIRYSTIQYRCPTSLLAQLCRQKHTDRVESCDGFLPDTREYFFERSGRLFEPIYDFLTIGHFHQPGDICRERLFKELDFWKIKKDFFAPCCMSMVLGESEDDDENPIINDGSVNYDDQFDGACWAHQRRKLWMLLEDPSSSSAAKVFALISIAMVLASVIGMILGSTPELQAAASVSANLSSDSSGLRIDIRPHIVLEHIELLCITWFTFEYFTRFFVCIEKRKFVRQPLNVIDSLTIVPFYMEILLSAFGFGAHTIGDFRGLAMVTRVVRVMRVARIFKLARYSSGLKSFGMTVKTSLPELSMLMLFLLTAIIFFSTLMYFAERDEPNTKFKSIAHAGWWRTKREPYPVCL